MKKIFIGIFIGLTLSMLFAHTNTPVSNFNKKTAEVNRIEGLLIFTDCRPLNSYDYLGTVKSNTGGFGGAQYEDVRKRLIRNTKRQFPHADGILLYLNKGQADKADAIKLTN